MQADDRTIGGRPAWPDRVTCLSKRDERFLLAGLRRDETSQRGVAIVLGFFLGSLVVASLALPPFHALLQWLRDWPGLTELRILPSLAGWVLGESVFRVFSYLRLLAVLACARAYVSEFGLAARGLNVSLPGRGGAAAGLGWLAAGCMLFSTAAVLQWSRGAVHMRADASMAGLLGTLPKAVPLAIVKGIGIEVIFRGFVLTAFYSATRRPPLALLLSAIFFAYAFSKGPIAGIADVEWWTGWQISFAVLTGVLLDPSVPSLLAYLLLGTLLGFLTLATRSLWPAIGLETSLMLVRLLYQDGFGLRGEVVSPLWGGPQLTDGWLAVGLLAGLLCWVVRRYGERSP